MRAGIHQEKAAGAVGVFRHARGEARLPEGRGLLVARDARNRDRPAEQRGVGLPKEAGRRQHLRQQGTGHIEGAQQVIVPLAGMDIEQHRAAGIRDIGNVARAAREPPDEKGIHGAEGEFAALRPRPRAGNVVEQPANLGRGKIGVNHEARFLADRFCQPGGTQGVAIGRGTAVLPDNRGGDWATRGSLPDQCRLALVRDPQRGESPPPSRLLLQGFPVPRRVATPRSPPGHAPPTPAAGRFAGTRAAAT